MTLVNGASRAEPARAPAPSPQAARADPNDVRAMREALVDARGKLDKPGAQPGKGRGKAGDKPMAGRGTAQPAPAPAPRADADQGTPRLRSRQRDGLDAPQGWGGQGMGSVPLTTTANPPSPQVDPGGFAQMLADLWTRENGRGSKEVRVRFGDRAWPATGARLVRTEAGTLDVALLVGDGGTAHGHRLPELEGALTGAGVDLNSLVIERDG